jgi:hypothetical protein
MAEPKPLYDFIAFLQKRVEKAPGQKDAVFYDIIALEPAPPAPADSVIWKGDLWRMHGSIGDNTFGYVFEKKLPRVVEDPEPEKDEKGAEGKKPGKP